MKDNLTKKTNLLKGCLCAFLWMIVIFFLLTKWKDGFKIGLLLSLTIATTLGIVISIISLPRKTFFRGALSVLLVIFLVGLLLFFGIPTLRIVSSYIYTPPALTTDNLTVYNKIIGFLILHNRNKSFTLTGDGIFDVPHAPFSQINEERFSVGDITNLCEQLRYLKCGLLKKDNDMVLFYKNANRILPTESGVLYSLSGKNPNEINNEVLSVAKPFFRITNNWYTSNHLITGDRTHPPVYISGLIDHSLKIDGIDPNELQKFD